ncbi:MAG: hypothetical protein KAI66_07725, partial [Lentisphaeria bacterium]|nr:hypothetical protein [Lentisphaeria bacterium]
LGEHSEPALVFTTLRFGDAPDPSGVLAQCPPGTPASLIRNLLGHGGRAVAREGVSSGRGVCRARVQFDTIYGCPHGCKYCGGGKVAILFTNLEEFVEKQVIPTAEAEPWQKVFMYNSCLSDTPCFEPEYGLSKLLVDYYASTRDQHYLIHTKSANVDFLCELDHRGHTIVLWSLTCETAARFVESGTASPEERIEAARKCQEAGYPIRFKIKPIVPVRGWRDEYRRIIDLLFERTRPDNVGLFMLAWMNVQELKSCIDVSLLDPLYVRALEESAESMKGVTAGPFPNWVRAEVYGFLLDEIRRHDKDIPVFLCTESPEMWREFAPRLGVDPSNYVCGCGPQCPPGLERLQGDIQVPTEVRA